MYLYNFGYSAHDESRYVQMRHDQKLTKRGLQKAFTTATVKALEYAVGHPDEFTFLEGGIDFEDLFDRIIIELEALGFQPVKFTAQIEVYGMASVVVPEDSNYAGSFEKNFYQSVPKHLRDRAIEISRGP
jgi:hypothetical protein